jgi:hypothetical protein
MASYRGHLMLACPLGAAYAAAGLMQWDIDWGLAVLAGGLTGLGGLLPDLDSDSGVPVREMFGAAAAMSPLFLTQRLAREGFNLEQTLVVLGAVYLFIRYGLSDVFKRWSTHRGMFHSWPAVFIAGLTAYLAYPNHVRWLRCYLAGGLMIGFLSHLVLDEIYAGDFLGVRFRPNKYAGSALKFTSPSRLATATTYLLLSVLGYLAWLDYTE